MSSVHGLQVHLRVPVAVVDDDNVGGVEVDAEAAGPAAQHEQDLAGPGLVKLLHLLVTILVRGLTVDPNQSIN